MDELPESVREAVQFEQSSWSNGSVLDDPFYTVSADAASAEPGALIKVEKDVDPSHYLLPPATALSRIVYQSEDLNGTLVPVSAAILWPFSPRSQQDGYQVVAWAHGTSGGAPDSAPSHYKSLWQHYLAPFQLALNGYVVVATDYAGLGVFQNASGSPIVNQYLACPSQANDVIYSVQAAREAFPELSKDFVVMGHSQGGGAAWAAAQRQAVNPLEGCLGCISVAPYTNLLNESEPSRSVLGAAMLPGLISLTPDDTLDSLLTAEGKQVMDLISSSCGSFASAFSLLYTINVLQPGWEENPQVQEYVSSTANGEKAIGCPLLAIHGQADPKLSPAVVTSAVERTRAAFPDAQLEYVLLEGISHTPALTASQRIWMDWIADRFAGRAIEDGSKTEQLSPPRIPPSYSSEQNWYLEPATEFYHAP